MLSGTASARSFGKLWHAGLWAAVGHRDGVGVGTGHTAGAGQKWKRLGGVGKKGDEMQKWERLGKEGRDRKRTRTKVCDRTIWLVVGWWQRGISVGTGVLEPLEKSRNGKEHIAQE